ncbi:hypothetical protein HN014_19055 [Aquimarina sp. TRL1]|uniref:hypothetical protein n=1 Tax=Aquimarina sp. (strain TRL1) TaxID=2736252 RepID=UPI00158BA2D3|nr:hypothetical protein [Aquimarina sp. TRL1]QKX06928.1 hypothetical protein HN014_19055 [Aquimarina sp. TRL1]
MNIRKLLFPVISYLRIKEQEIRKSSYLLLVLIPRAESEKPLLNRVRIIIFINMGYRNIAASGRERPVYASDKVTNASEVSALVTKIRKDLGTAEMNKVIIYILSGTHGNTQGDLVGEKVFFAEDKTLELQTVKAVNVNQDTPPNTWKKYFGASKAIVILAWCYSDRWKGLATYNK